MTSKKPFSYVVLRYVHDIISEEFVNVGLILVSPTEQKLLAETRKKYGRIKNIFPDLDQVSFVQAMKTFDRGVKPIRKKVATEGMFSDQRNASEYARLILPLDDSALQWSSVGSGLTDNADETFERLFERYVSRYDQSSPKRKSDDDVWRPVKKMLSDRGVELPLGTKIIEGTTDSIEFDHAWKNGLWHAYKPLSFDLSDADGIKNKARQLRGHLAAAADGATEELQLHLLLGKPDNQVLMGAYNSAKDILRGAPFSPSLFEDDNLDAFVSSIEDEVHNHSANYAPLITCHTK